MESEWILGRLAGGFGFDSTGSGYGPVVSCCECGDEPSGSCATELVICVPFTDGAPVLRHRPHHHWYGSGYYYLLRGKLKKRHLIPHPRLILGRTSSNVLSYFPLYVRTFNGMFKEQEALHISKVA
jgi:hypothetical protein